VVLGFLFDECQIGSILRAGNEAGSFLLERIEGWHDRNSVWTTTGFVVAEKVGAIATDLNYKHQRACSEGL